MSGQSAMQQAVEVARNADKAIRVTVFTQTICWNDFFTPAFFWQQAADNMRRWVHNAADRRRITPALQKQNGRPIIYIEEMDCLRMAKYLTLIYGKDFAVLNFANAHTPGGGVKRGAGAQEENIFRRTDCYDSIPVSDCISANKNKYTPRMVSLLEAEHDVVYIDTKQLRVCTRDQENALLSDLGYRYLTPTEMFSFIELRAAAINMGSDKMKSIYPAATFHIECSKRIEAQFSTLVSSNVRHVVLGAFGCGAFMNPPQVVSDIYMKMIKKYEKYFDVIAFPIIHSASNLACFRSSLATNRLVKQDIYQDLHSHGIDLKTPFTTERLTDWTQSCTAAKQRYTLNASGRGAPANTAMAASGPVQGAAAVQPKVQSGLLTFLPVPVPSAAPGMPGGLPKPGESKRPAASPIPPPKSPKRAANVGEPGGQSSGRAAGGAAGPPAVVAHGVQPVVPFKRSLPKIIVPMQYLSALQGLKIREMGLTELYQYIPKLPMWVPTSEIITAFKLSQDGLNVALLTFKVPFVWATEFEIRRRTWLFDEPRITVGSETYDTAAIYFDEQKRRCLTDPVNGVATWASYQDTVMRQALQFRFAASPILTNLLIESHPHKLLCINANDSYWGWNSKKGGQNKLGELLTILRTDLVKKASAGP